MQKGIKTRKMLPNRSSTLVLVVVCLIALTSCTSVRVVEPKPITLPKLEAVRPPVEPKGLIGKPKGLPDMLTNSLDYEQAFYDWQDYAIIGLEVYIDRIGIALEKL